MKIFVNRYGVFFSAVQLANWQNDQNEMVKLASWQNEQNEMVKLANWQNEQNEMVNKHIPNVGSRIV